jgi:hypothetical protein
LSEATRRDFLLQSAGALASATVAEPHTQSSSTKKTIGIQIGAVSFADEGVDRVLDILQSQASVNTLFIAAFTYGRGIAGRQVPGQPLPDHGKQEYDTGTFHGGSYAAIYPEYYAGMPLKISERPTSVLSTCSKRCCPPRENAE